MRYLWALFLVCSFCHAKESVFVSVSAYQSIVQQMIGEAAEVRTVVPAGANFHTFEPTPSLAKQLSHARLWLRIGDSFEKPLFEALSSLAYPPYIVDLRKNVALIYGSACGHHREADPHIWTDPKSMQVQLTTIREALIESFPQEKERIEAKYVVLSERLNLLIEQTDQILAECKGTLIIIAHGAYAYLCQEHGLEQHPLEYGEKELSIAQSQQLLSRAKGKVHTVFSLKQYSKKPIERFAQLLGARIVELDPFAPDYFENTLCTVQSFRKVSQEEAS